MNMCLHFKNYVCITQELHLVPRSWNQQCLNVLLPASRMPSSDNRHARRGRFGMFLPHHDADVGFPSVAIRLEALYKHQARRASLPLLPSNCAVPILSRLALIRHYLNQVVSKD